MANAAISYKQRDLVARALEMFAADHLDRDEAREAQALAERISRPGPPLVSTADVEEVLDLVWKIDSLQVRAMLMGEFRPVLDHPWGVVRFSKEDDGWRLADPGQLDAEGNFRNGPAHKIAGEMYENHLRGRGLLP